MPKDGSIQNNSWPLPEFHFILKMDTEEIAFQEVSGLDPDGMISKHRQGNTKTFSTLKMPEMQKPGPLTLRRGALQKGSKFWDWFHQISMNVPNPKTATLSLLDSEGNTRMRWSLMKVWPTKATAAGLSSHSNEFEIESITELRKLYT